MYFHSTFLNLLIFKRFIILFIICIINPGQFFIINFKFLSCLYLIYHFDYSKVSVNFEFMQCILIYNFMKIIKIL